VFVYLAIKALLALALSLLFHHSVSSVFLASPNNNLEQRIMWRRFKRELNVKNFVMQQIKLRQFMEKNAKKESFRSLILEASDISSSEERKKVKLGKSNMVEAQDLDRSGSEHNI